MVIKIICDKIIDNGTISEGFVYIRDGVIDDISTSNYDTDMTIDCHGYNLSPGFIDMHTHGGAGHPFINGTVDDVEKACMFHLRHGTTSIVPTVSAAPFPVMYEAVKNISKAKSREIFSGTIIGAHLEGPYLSKNQCGAQQPSFITNPVAADYESIVEELSDNIARWTYAPENDKEGKFCRYITEHGIVASAGHSDACYNDMITAIDNGCRIVTHLYSCTSTITRENGFRKPGIIETAYIRDDLYAEIIADGKHLPPELINMILKIKGTDSVALVTDSLSVTGTEALDGTMSGTDYIIEDGVCKLRDRSAFAGSIATADLMLRVMTKKCNVPLPQAVKMLTNVPSDILKIKKGKLKHGYDADIAVFDDDINIMQVLCRNSDKLVNAYKRQS